MALDNYAVSLRYLQHGDTYSLQRLKQKYGDIYHFETTSILAAAGNTHCIEYAIKDGCNWHYMTTQNAAQYNHTETLQFALKNGCMISSNCLSLALKNKNIKCADICIAYGLTVEIHCSIDAVISGSLDCMEWYKTHTPNMQNRWLQTCGECAVKKNKVELLEFLYRDGFRFGSFELLSAFDYLYMTSFLFILNCLYEARIELNPTYLYQLNRKADRLDIERYEIRQFLFDYEDRRLLACFPALRMIVNTKKENIRKSKEIIHELDILHHDIVEYILGEYL